MVCMFLFPTLNIYILSTHNVTKFSFSFNIATYNNGKNLQSLMLQSIEFISLCILEIETVSTLFSCFWENVVLKIP